MLGRERLERAAKCARCGHQGGRLEDPTRGSGASLDADLMLPVEMTSQGWSRGRSSCGPTATGGGAGFSGARDANSLGLLLGVMLLFFG
jgi:hypothetical protein